MIDIFNTIEKLSDKLKPLFMEEDEKKNAGGLNEQNEQPSSEYTNSENQNINRIKPSGLQIFIAVLNGLGVGLLLGLLLGLAVSPVVSGVIGTLSSILVVLLGLNDKYMSILKGLRIGSFGIFAVVGVLSGMYIRTHNVLSPDPAELMMEYRALGLEKNEALFYVARQSFDYVPAGWFGTTLADTVANNKAVGTKQSVLFSTEVDVGRCYVLNSVKRSFPKAEVIRAFNRAGGVWQELVNNLEPVLPEKVFIDAMVDLRDSFCSLGTEGKIEIKSSDRLLKFNSDSKLSEIKEAIGNSGNNWEIILKNTESNIPENYQKELYLTLIKTFTDDKEN